MSDERVEVETGASRRALFLGAGAVGATTVLAACGTDGGGDPYAPPGNTGGGSTPSETSPGGDTGDDDSGEDGDVLVTTDEVEVGGGVIISQASVVVTQPTEGDFKGFSAACTHQGCIVSSISDGIIHCACHGSQYSIEDGAVIRAAISGQRPLPEVEISVEGSNVTKV